MKAIESKTCWPSLSSSNVKHFAKNKRVYLSKKQCLNIIREWKFKFWRYLGWTCLHEDVNDFCWLLVSYFLCWHFRVEQIISWKCTCKWSCGKNNLCKIRHLFQTRTKPKKVHSFFKKEDSGIVWPKLNKLSKLIRGKVHSWCLSLSFCV